MSFEMKLYILVGFMISNWNWIIILNYLDRNKMMLVTKVHLKSNIGICLSIGQFNCLSSILRNYLDNLITGIE